ncbi:MAG: adenine deaminase [Planctomycetota bacterium]
MANGEVMMVRGNVVDIRQQSIFAAEVEIREGRIAAIRPVEEAPSTFLMPGFIDSHIHIESSMLTPGEFARAAVVHGTVATVSDPHEIANVLGEAGVRFMLNAAKGVPFKFHFGVPSCVPATNFETAGARLDADAVARLLDDPQLGYLSEMMNYPGVLAGDREVIAKIDAARQRGKPVDGHAPGLRGEMAEKYVAAGITTDHECTTRDEALEKLAAGCKIQIREGSAARNFDALYTLIDDYPDNCMFCSDDKHPDELSVGHIDVLVRTAIERGMDTMKVLRVACLNPVEHYSLNVGTLQVGDPADLIEVDDLKTFRIRRTWIAGQLVAENGKATFDVADVAPMNEFRASPKSPDDFRVPAQSTRVRVIVAEDGELITGQTSVDAKVEAGFAAADPERDILKIAVVNRYEDTPPAVAFIKNVGLKQGAIASSVAHDCHNVVAVGVDDESLCRAVNLVIDNKGGLSVAGPNVGQCLPLPIAGLMSPDSCRAVGDAYHRLNEIVASFGSPLRAPFMTLSFMALLVIPSLKLSDRGLFDGEKFEFVSLFE